MYNRLIPALFLIVLGTLFLLNNLGLSHMDLGGLIAIWWPVMLVAAGIRQLLRKRAAAVTAC
ncbi:LiaF transmembrane domain-containing protein [Xanthomonas maliensis]|uniref:LiaF transmembrane domain-containing protein n=1 Tax=Xanthomonas maliensis TaxID=1321368 RepID=UPI00039A17AB|nr:DUF5668 domain-containing protein [Xanthomonas maliensis]KAB7770048.1 hypothetical protein CKY51_04625 [Xanthomonas maliensis]